MMGRASNSSGLFMLSLRYQFVLHMEISSRQLNTEILCSD